MDELLIEEKRYISSKRAAKLTGYAKDYIGQLCREGRVPARLVGRSWYVLETAIQDHRFGDNKVMSVEEHIEKKEIVSNWESPKYEAISEEAPVINFLHSSDVNDKEVEIPIESQNLHDSWRSWFDKVTQVEQSEKGEEKVVIKKLIKEEERHPAAQKQEIQEELKVVGVSYTLPPKSLLPGNREEEKRQQEPLFTSKDRIQGGANLLIGVTLVLIALSASLFAVLNSGYADKLVISSRHFEIVTGLRVYNK